MIKELGDFSGKMLVFGGVYSNFQALQALKQEADNQSIPPQNIICTGDVVAYCAQPEECVQLIKEWGIHCIAGNVEIQLREGLSDCACDFTDGSRCDTFSKQWYPFAQSSVSKNTLNWMKSLPEFLYFRYANKPVAVVHGSFHHTSEFVFASSDWAIKQQNFQDTQADVILAGHCGLPFSHEQGDKYWLNSGVIGMPANDGTPRVWYMILEDKEGKISYEHHALEYNYLLAKELMIESCLPLEYANTLASGLWDNCEILPKVETSQQGKPYIFAFTS